MSIFKAVKKINPNAEFKYDDEDINSIEWLNGTTPISKADIEAQFPAVELEIAMADLRSNRNRLLAASDWTQLTDTTLTSSEKSQWMNYRTELRNLTNGITTVEQANNVAMPTIPNG